MKLFLFLWIIRVTYKNKADALEQKLHFRPVLYES